MADCKLSIQLDDPETPRKGGDPVTGTIVVTCGTRLKCSGLDVSTCWTTHGRGNIDQGVVDESVVFEGSWDANQEYRYKFSLKSATWPPTYYGTYLNVSHLVRARARVSWTSDPKAEVEFPVVASAAPEDLKPTVSEKKKSSSLIGLLVGWTIGLVLLVLVGVVVSAMILIFVPIVLIGGACYWFFRVFLPRQVTGNIECTIEPQRLTAGDTVRGMLRFTPKRNSIINGIDLNVKCGEKCSSGSGSNRTTHQHEIFTTAQRLSEAGTLPMGQAQLFEFSFTVPENAPPSLKFSNNELNWAGEIRIDIPRWPDWVHKFTLTVSPKEGKFLGAIPNLRSLQNYDDSDLETFDFLGRPPTTEERTWFDEVVRQVLQSRADLERMQTILQAIGDQDLVMQMELTWEDSPDPELTRWGDGQWMFGLYEEQDVEVCVLWPTRDAPGDDTYLCSGKVNILGYDNDLDALILRLLPRA